MLGLLPDFVSLLLCLCTEDKLSYNKQLQEEKLLNGKMSMNFDIYQTLCFFFDGISQ
jgi:hypothetical protein